MCRICCLLILALCAIGLPAQELTDSIDVVSQQTTIEDEIPMTDGQRQLMRKGISRSWWRAHQNSQKNRGIPKSLPFEARQSADSLRRVVMNLQLPAKDEDYLYAMRLPLISNGSVADTTTLHLSDYMSERDSRDILADSILRGYEHHYDVPQLMEKERHLSRFRYAEVDPRRFRFARRKIDMPTLESQIIDTRNNVLTTRLVDEAELDLGDATLEGFGQQIVLKADKWHWKGDHTLQMQQTALSDNWYKGGENNMSVISQQKLVVNRYDENAKTTFDMIIDLKLSGYYTKADTLHAMKVSDNQLSLDMKYGYKAWKKWYYSTQVYAKTPIFDQYQSNNAQTKATFLSPLEVNVSVGMDYKYTSPNKKFVYSLMLAPVSYNLKYVRDGRVDPVSYGIDEGEFAKHEFGSTLTSKLDWKMGKYVSWSSRLYCFTSYSSILAEFENTFNFNISRFFSARVYAYPRFDDSRDSRLQIKEMLTFGFSYQW